MVLKKALKIMTQPVCGTLVPSGEISLPAIQLHANSRECQQQVKRTLVHDRIAAPIFSFQAFSSGKGSICRNMPLFWFIAVWQPHHWSAVHLHSMQGSGDVLSICLHLPWLSTVPHSASPDKQLHKGTRENLLAASMLQLNACFLFMAPSTPINFRNSLIMFFLTIQLVFINLFYVYPHITP